jgi:ATP-binding protein involved in chromosome partitioning
MESAGDRQKIVCVMSGKGGVGKSTLSAMLATKISLLPRKVLLLDFDICGPSIGHLMGLGDERVVKAEKGLVPIRVPGTDTLWVLTMASMVKKDSSVVWRAPKKVGLLNLFIESIDERYDCVVIDMPPGLGVEHDLVRHLPATALVVTTSQNLSLQEAEATIEFCKTNGMRLVGVVENMSCARCECCGEVNRLFSQGGGRVLSEEMEVDFLGEIEIDKSIEASTEGRDFVKHVSEMKLGVVDLVVEKILSTNYSTER